MTAGRPAFTLEDKVASLEQRFERFYHSTYATQKRKDRRHLKRRLAASSARAIKVAESLKKYRNTLKRAAAVYGKKRPGTNTVFLTRREINRLRYMLENWSGYKPRAGFQGDQNG